MNKIETLKDGKQVVIRSLRSKDLDKLMAFYRSLPIEDRKYLRVDVTDRKVVAQRMKSVGHDDVLRIIALYKDQVVGDGALELSGEGWRKHQGELRVIVARAFRRRGLGLIMMRELYFLAAARNVKKLVAKMMRPQKSARAICLRLGFREELLIPDYVEDLSGKTQDLVIMTCDLNVLWSELEEFYGASDWQRCR
jgi:L-amino acid N-acyltransferase YncA